MAKFPELKIKKVEVLTNRGAMQREGISQFPALVSGEKKLSGFFLTKGEMLRYLETL